MINRGNNYISPPDIIVQDFAGTGRGAVVVPVLGEIGSANEGHVMEVKVLSGGTGYSQQNTKAFSVSPGGGCELKASLQKWRVNLVGKHFNQFTLDDGFMTEGWEGSCLLYTSDAADE